MRKIKNVFLSIVLGIVLLTLGKLMIDGNAGKQQVNNFEFPTQVPLEGWKKMKTMAIESNQPETDKPYDRILAAQKYYYQQDNKDLEIKMSYVVGTLGRAKIKVALQQQYTRNLTPEQISPEWTKKDNLQYAILDFDGRSHLISCINSRGGSTVTSDEFRKNRRKHDLQPSRLLPWLMGKETLLDRRCLWAELSLPIQEDSKEESHKLLESTWFTWYDWWSDNFPPISS